MRLMYVMIHVRRKHRGDCMYYIEAYLNAWLIKKAHDDVFTFGPFESEADAYFVCEMLNNDKLRFKVGVGYGKESIEDTQSVY
jgi:hypothetical protein